MGEEENRKGGVGRDAFIPPQEIVYVMVIPAGCGQPALYLPYLFISFYKLS